MGIERVNAEIKRRTKVVGAFPSQSSLLRLVVSILIDINEEWITGIRYLNMSELVEQQLSEIGQSIKSVKQRELISTSIS